jgi:hypothetical protein
VTPFPVFRISVQNATLLSALYLAAATALEGIRRVWNPRWAEKACLAMEAFPARALDVVGLLDFVKKEYAWGALTQFHVRLIFGLATIAVIFLLAIVVGFGMWLFAKCVLKGEEAT